MVKHDTGGLIQAHMGAGLSEASAPYSGAVKAGETAPARPRLAQILRARGEISEQEMRAALDMQRHQALPLGEILIANNQITEDQLLDALAEQFSIAVLPANAPPPEPELAALLPAKRAAALSSIPLQRIGGALVVATYRPDLKDEIITALAHDGPVLFTLAGRAQVQTLLTGLYGDVLARAAEARTPLSKSCRAWNQARATRLSAMLVLIFLTGLSLAPAPVFAALFGVAVLIAAANMVLRLLAILAMARPAPAPGKIMTPLEPRQMPIVTILLPLLNEHNIAGQLIKRIERIDYPRELLDVLLLVESHDVTTQKAIDAATLPKWMRAITVPEGTPLTKPRALNYGLNFARGSIVGVYDAEDAPEPDQVRKVAERFVDLPDSVVCLQGQLDFYNPTHNWISRCFTLEYATWFRLLLPGVERLGLFVPLGGTTLFFRRKPLEDIGAWDAHNVTEDADLGLRLVRAGYRTEIIETTTFEEANAAMWPWVKQRSRWLKGYAMTWATHMRDPGQLWRDLGAKRFIGLQAQLLGAVLGFALAPILWTLVVKVFGGWHPVDLVLGPVGFICLMVFFVFLQVLTWVSAWRASYLARHRRLRFWIPILDLYFMLASAASFLALVELLARPFHWRKTAHGRYTVRGQG